MPDELPQHDEPTLIDCAFCGADCGEGQDYCTACGQDPGEGLQVFELEAWEKPTLQNQHTATLRRVARALERIARSLEESAS